jgi:hypothetical protein
MSKDMVVVKSGSNWMYAKDLKVGDAFRYMDMYFITTQQVTDSSSSDASVLAMNLSKAVEKDQTPRSSHILWLERTDRVVTVDIVYSITDRSDMPVIPMQRSEE